MITKNEAIELIENIINDYPDKIKNKETSVSLPAYSHVDLEQGFHKLDYTRNLSDTDAFVIVEDSTLEKEWGWVFFYTSEMYLKTGDPKYALAGNAPYIVIRESGDVFVTGTAQSIEYYLEAFEACGDPNAELTSKIEIYGWEEGAMKIETTKLINNITGLGLKDAKSIVDMALQNQSAVFSASSVSEATDAVDTIRNLKFKCKQLWSNQ